MTDAVALLDVDAGFRDRPVLHGVTLAASAGQIVAVVGLNGAGKSVLGRTISGLVQVARGQVMLGDRDVTSASPRARVRLGLHHLSQRRGLVPELTVADNVRIAAFGAGRALDDRVIHAHPVLGRWREQRTGTLSGGEQALVALARAELLEPRVLIADEPTAGLAPDATEHHAVALRRQAEHGTCIVLIEQNLRFALRVADRIVVMRSGTIALDTATSAASDDVLSHALVG